MPLPFFTIGHSTRTLGEFTALLLANGIKNLVDVRTVPRSRTNPQFNGSTLPGELAGQGISYSHSAMLGGLRGKAKGISPEINGFWTNDSFHNYADHAMTPAYGEAITALVEVGRRQITAVMCAEAVWWRCHRRVIADYLIARGETVFHIMGEDHVELAELTAGAVVRPDHTVIYPAKQRDLFT